MKRFLALSFLVLLSTTAEAKMITKEIPYKDGDVSLTGYLAYDDAVKTPAPGVLVVQEWWGQTDYVRSRTEQLAKMGYIAFAADMYGDRKIVETPDEAKALTEPFYADRGLMRQRGNAALETLKAQPQVDKRRLGVIGFCFGGTTALELARFGVDVKGVVSFHGGLDTDKPAVPAAVKAQVLALNGADDPMVPPAQKDAFKKEMETAGVTYKSIDYAGATHAFTNPGATEKGKKFNMPVAYNEKAATESWAEMSTFFQRLFK